MPVLFDSSARQPESGGRCVRVGLVNNMGDEALKATERQFVALLGAAAEGIEVRLSFYTLPGIPRTPALARHIDGLYTDIDKLWRRQLDGLIVTGREPLAARLDEEPYWPVFTRLVEWARENAHATVWSCLAAHAAILHMDGIERVKRSGKLFGIFDCVQASRHALLTEMPATVRLPHSRWNGIAEDRLLDCGYEVLTRGVETGVDTFIKEEKKLFLFFQGHPEYAADTLLREYRRDAGRYVRGETDCYPALPSHYFDAVSSSSLTRLSEKAKTTRNPQLMTEVAAELEKCVIETSWSSSSVTIYRNWLQYLCAQKGSQPARAEIVAELVPGLVL